MPQVNLKIYSSDRLEVLAEQLAGVASAPLHSPLAPEIIVVQSRGMKRGISIALDELTADPFFDLCFRGLDPINVNFQATALQVFQPMFTHVSEIKL